MFGQQQSLFTNAFINPIYYAPAYVGSTNYHEVGFFHRSQWVGFKGAPSNFYFNFHGSYKNRAKHGYGFQLENERTGLLSKTGVYANYGYQMRLSDKLKLGFGIRPGFAQYRVRIYDGVIADEGDDVFSASVYSGNAFDVNAGFRLYSERFEFVGTFQHVISKALPLKSYNQNLQFHYTALVSYRLALKKGWELKPALLFNYTQPVPPQLSVLLQATYQDKYFGGFSFRSSDAVGIFLGLNLFERLSITYGYDYSFSGIRKYSNGSHEVGIKFILTKNRPSLEQQDDELNNSILDEMQRQEELDNGIK